jgi:hypothetical protein
MTASVKAMFLILLSLARRPGSLAGPRPDRAVHRAALLVLARERHGYELRDDVAALVGDHADVANLYRLLRQLELEDRSLTLEHGRQWAGAAGCTS